jgi:hypothetical protein
LAVDNGGTITPKDAISGPVSKEVCHISGWLILIVEAPIVRKFLRTVLEREGYEPIEAEPLEAQELMRSSSPPVGLVVTNAPGVFLPFAERAHLIYIAACPNLDLAARFRTCRVLQKPFHPADLLELVRSLRVRCAKAVEPPAG